MCIRDRYHGGINPDGKYSTLQESRDTGYNNDLPVKSYDFQTCIRQSGQLGASYGRLKKLHLMLEDFGEILAGAQTFFPDILPDSPEDMQTLRVTARVNPDTGAGFLFLNNHQRMRRMAEHRNVSVKLYEEKGQMELEDLCLKDGECAVIPFRFPVGEGENRRVLERTNASLLCRLKNRLFLYTDEKAVVRWKGEAGEVTILTTSPVSYTHLDVYKRQPMYSGFTMRSGKGNGIFPAAATCALSWKHAGRWGCPYGCGSVPGRMGNAATEDSRTGW